MYIKIFFSLKKTYLIGMKEGDDLKDAEYLNAGFDDIRVKPFQIKLNEIIN